MAKVLIEKKVLNYILKSLEIHMNLLKEEKIYMKDKNFKKRFEKSIEHIEEVPKLIKGEREYLQMKRAAYYKYFCSKQKLINAESEEDKEKLKKETEERLKYYLALKELCEIAKKS